MRNMRKDLIDAAYAYAEKIHVKQTRPSSKGRVPYVGHLISVAERLKAFGVDDPEILAAAYLHDSVEDQAYKILLQDGQKIEDKSRRTPLALDVLAREFSPRVAELVGYLTNPELPSELSKKEKRAEYQKHVREIIAADPDAALIKVSDYLDNAGRILDSLDHKGRALHFHAKYAPLIDDFIGFFEDYEDKEIASKILFALKDTKRDLQKARRTLVGG